MLMVTITDNNSNDYYWSRTPTAFINRFTSSDTDMQYVYLLLLCILKRHVFDRIAIYVCLSKE